jgi:hypothetical protein
MEAVVTDRRRHERVPAEWTSWRELRLRTGDALTLLDISTAGVLVESRRQLLPGVRVVLHVRNGNGELAIEARIVRCSVSALEREGGVKYRGALEFVGEESELAPSPSRAPVSGIHSRSSDLPGS